MNWKALSILCSLAAAGCGEMPSQKPHFEIKASSLREEDKFKITIEYTGKQESTVDAEVNGQTVIP